MVDINTQSLYKPDTGVESTQREKPLLTRSHNVRVPMAQSTNTEPSLTRLLASVDLRDTAWMQDGLCNEIAPDLWFPEKGEWGNTSRRAQAVCRSCPVVDQCLQYALDEEIDFGIWGALSAAAREQLLTERNREAG